jgi:hypothetical protein
MFHGKYTKKNYIFQLLSIFFSNSNYGQIESRIKKYCRIFGRTQRFAPTSKAGLRAIVGANLVFARPGNAIIRIPGGNQGRLDFLTDDVV